MRVNPRGHVDLIHRPRFDQKLWRLFFPKSLRAPKADIARHDDLIDIMKTWANLPDGAKLLHMLEEGGFEIPEYTPGVSTAVFAPDATSTQVWGWCNGAGAWVHGAWVQGAWVQGAECIDAWSGVHWCRQDGF